MDRMMDAINKSDSESETCQASQAVEYYLFHAFLLLFFILLFTLTLV
jgi:hypothetical protein